MHTDSESAVARPPGETDLAVMLATLDVHRRPGLFTFVCVDEPSIDALGVSHATVVEDEGTTLVLDVEDARRLELPVVIEMAWLSLSVNSSLEAVGLTAAFSAALGNAAISCNVLAGYHHDHLLVPAPDADKAIHTLRNLSTAC